jgi:hypothetical protein
MKLLKLKTNITEISYSKTKLNRKEEIPGGNYWKTLV